MKSLLALWCGPQRLNALAARQPCGSTVAPVGTASACPFFLPMNAQPTITKEQTADGDVWVIRVEENGKTQEYRCASEQQAKQLAQVLAPQK